VGLGEALGPALGEVVGAGAGRSRPAGCSGAAPSPRCAESNAHSATIVRNARRIIAARFRAEHACLRFSVWRRLPHGYGENVNPEVSSSARLVDRLGRTTIVDPLADAIQPAVRAALDGTGPLALLKDTLHGTPLNHPLHPALTDIPVGAWSVAAVFDCLELAGRREYRAAANLSIGVGLAGAVAAVATGLAEWSDTVGEPKRLGTWHALLNTLGAGAYLSSLVLRAKGNRGVALATAFAGYALVGMAGYLGGELAFGLHIGAKHAAPPIFPPSDFTDVLPDAELPLGSHKRVDFGGIPVLLSRGASGAVHAVAAVCTHRGGPLDEGEFADGCVRCPWHGGRFSLADGSVLAGPPVFPLARFETRLRDGQIELRAFT